MSLSLFIIGIVVGGIATLVTIIFTIISLATGKKQNAIGWGVGFVIAISILVLSIFQVVRKVGEKVRSGVEWLEENKGKYEHNDHSDDVYAREQRQNYLDSLEKYTTAAVREKMPADYYSNRKAPKDADGKYRLPFIYPLCIRYDELNYTGEIISDISDTVYLPHILEIAFDENFAIAKVDNTGDTELLKDTERGEVEYILFDLRTREFLNFKSREQLLDKADKIGYTGPTYMSNLQDLFDGWTDPLNFDF